MAITYSQRMSKADSVTIGERKYTRHAEERMRERHIIPTIIDCVMANPDEQYEIQPNDKRGCAIRVYVKRNVADINPSGGGVGERIISVRKPGEKRDYKNVLVMMDVDDVVRTIVVLDDRSLEKLIEKKVKGICAEIVCGHCERAEVL